MEMSQDKDIVSSDVCAQESYCLTNGNIYPIGIAI